MVWYLADIVYLRGSYESGSQCNQCKDRPTFSTVYFIAYIIESLYISMCYFV